MEVRPGHQSHPDEGRPRSFGRERRILTNILDLYKVFEPMSFHKASDKCRDQGGNIPLGRFQNSSHFIGREMSLSDWLKN